MKSEEGCRRCHNCLHKWTEEVAKRDRPIVFNCHSGLVNFGIPLSINGEYVATVLGGKVLTENPDEAHFRQLARGIGVDENEYVEQARKIRIIPHEKFKVIAESLFLVANSITSIAYAKSMLSEIGLDYKIPRDIEIEKWLVLNREGTQSLLTPREFEVLRLLVAGKNNSEIAEELCVSVHTAKAHVSSILEKFMVEDRVQMAVKAVKEGLI